MDEVCQNCLEPLDTDGSLCENCRDRRELAQIVWEDELRYQDHDFTTNN
jgi:hypothetical protein